MNRLLLLFPIVLEAQTLRRPLAELPIRAHVAVPASADWMAMGYGAVWVVNYKPNRVSRVDPTTARVLADIPLASKACLGIVIALGRVWIPTCGDSALNAIDPATNRVAQRWPLPIAPGREGSFAFSDGSFWVGANIPDSSSSDIARVDARSGQVERRIQVGARSDVVVAGFGAVWVASSATNTVARIDPARNDVVAQIAVGPSPKFMTIGSGALWVQNRGDGSVSRIDPGTNRVSYQFVGGSGVDAIRVGYGALWLADHEHGDVWKVDVMARSTADARDPR